jgi:hypothetical protein
MNTYGLNWKKAKKNPLASMLMNKAMSVGQNFAKKQICSGNVDTIKANAIRALEMMPASSVSAMIQKSPLCSGQGSMFGGKKAKTRKLKRKLRKTRKH